MDRVNDNNKLNNAVSCKAKKITNLDYPDPDVIRVGDTYYMVSTTMYYMPGGEILRSKDLINWEHASFVYDYLDGTPGHKLQGDNNIYGKGMWAASLTYYDGKFYVVFACNDTQKTYIYSTTSMDEPWEKNVIEGLYYDNSLFFDDDGRVYIIHGHNKVQLTELEADLSEAKKNGFNRVLIEDPLNKMLGYEGSHFYKINGRYYLFNIHSLSDRWRRVQSVFSSDSLDGDFVGGDCFNYDLGYCNMGIAQGGIVDTPDGKWFSILFQDSGAVGRVPVLVPIKWENGQPIFGVDDDNYLEKNTKVPVDDLSCVTLVGSDDFKQIKKYDKEKYDCFGLRSHWQFNHEPDMSLIEHDVEAGSYSVTTDRVCKTITQSINTLAQRMIYPGCSGQITIDASCLNEGDYCGIAALQGRYGFVAVTKRDDKYYLVMKYYPKDRENADTVKEVLAEEVEIDSPMISLKIEVDFTMMKDEANFYYKSDDSWKKIGVTHKLMFSLDHFTGCRFGLFMYSTKTYGGKGTFSEFIYEIKNMEVGK